MDVSSIAGQASDAALGSVQAAAQVTMLRKALDMQQVAAMQLLQALPEPTSSGAAGAGAIINTYA